MENLSPTCLILMSAIAIIAFFIGYLVSGKRDDNKRLETELSASQEELQKYRSEVTHHFQQTAHKVHALTENCRDVYEHLANGAEELCNKDDAPQLMDELNKNRLHADAAHTKPEVLAEEPATAKHSASHAELKKDNESPDNSTPSDAVEDKAISTAADQETNATEHANVDKKHAYESGVNVDEHQHAESTMTAEDSVKSDKHGSKQKPST